MSFPSTTTLTTNHLDSDSDLLTEARSELKTALETLQQILASKNGNNGVAVSDASNLVSSSLVNDRVDSNALVDESITSGQLTDSSVDSDAIDNDQINPRHLNFIEETLSSSSSKVTTVKSVRDYIKTKIPQTSGTIYSVGFLGDGVNCKNYTAYGVPDVNALGNGTNNVIVGVQLLNRWINGATSVSTNLYSVDFGRWNEGNTSIDSKKIFPLIKIYYQQLSLT